MMGMADIRRAFQSGLGDKASCVGARMTYAKGEERGQRLVFDVQTPAGEARTVERIVPHTANINDEAHVMGSTFAATL